MVLHCIFSTVNRENANLGAHLVIPDAQCIAGIDSGYHVLLTMMFTKFMTSNRDFVMWALGSCSLRSPGSPCEVMQVVSLHML